MKDNSDYECDVCGFMCTCYPDNQNQMENEMNERENMIEEYTQTATEQMDMGDLLSYAMDRMSVWLEEHTDDEIRILLKELD